MRSAQRQVFKFQTSADILAFQGPCARFQVQNVVRDLKKGVGIIRRSQSRKSRSSLNRSTSSKKAANMDLNVGIRRDETILSSIRDSSDHDDKRDSSRYQSIKSGQRKKKVTKCRLNKHGRTNSAAYGSLIENGNKGSGGATPRSTLEAKDMANQSQMSITSSKVNFSRSFHRHRKTQIDPRIYQNIDQSSMENPNFQNSE